MADGIGILGEVHDAPGAPLAPTPPVVPPPSRFHGGWVMFGLVYLLLAAGSLYAYFQPGDNPGQAPSEVGPQVIVALGSEGLEALSPEAGRQGRDTGQDTWRRMLADAGGAKPKGPEAAKQALVAARELGQTPPPTVFDALGPKDGDWVKLYSGAKLTTDQAKGLNLEAEAPRIEALARAQALQAAGDDSARKALVADSTWKLMALSSLLLVVFLGLVALAVGITLLAKRQWQPLGPVLAPMTPLRADTLAFRAATALGAMIMLPGLAGAVAPQAGLWASVVGYAIAVAATVAILWFPILDDSPGLRGCIGDTTNLARHVGLGIAAFLANWPLMLPFVGLIGLLGPYLPQPSHPMTDVIGGASGRTILAIYLLAAVGAPLLEEIVFRGMLFPALARFLKPGWAMVLCGFLFASIHPQGPLLWAMLTIVGAMGAFLTYMTRSLVPAIVMHSVHNASVLTLALIVTG